MPASTGIWLDKEAADKLHDTDGHTSAGVIGHAISAPWSYAGYTGGRPRRPITENTTNITMPTTNKIQAILVAVPAIPVKPNMAATIAMTRNVTAQET